MVSDILSILLVGAIWGFTNPFIRRGTVDASPGSGSKDERSPLSQTPESLMQDSIFNTSTIKKSKKSKAMMLKSLSRFRRHKVWVPYLLNQCGSLLYYKLLATSDLTIAVPVCNSLALVFSSVASFFLGERLDRPFRAGLGVALVAAGVTICVHSKDLAMPAEEL